MEDVIPFPNCQQTWRFDRQNSPTAHDGRETRVIKENIYSKSCCFHKSISPAKCYTFLGINQEGVDKVNPPVFVLGH
jgi:hypothetical protein